MLSIRPLEEADTDAILNIQLPEQQVIFTASPADFLSALSANVTPFVICFEGKVVGYFKVDTVVEADISLDAQSCVILKSLALDARCQGKGLGTQAMAMLASFLPSFYPNTRWLYLTVNCKNLVAYQCYVRGGFEDTGALFLGGPGGPQHIMRVQLH